MEIPKPAMIRMTPRFSRLLAGFRLVAFGLLALLVCPVMAQTGSAAVKPPAARKPNILLLLADDWAWPHASCLGDPVVKTPTFDRLAREGVMFRNAHSADPSCSPSRAAILTGRQPWELREGANLWAYIPVQFEVYPDLLQKAGYFIGLEGKGYGPGVNLGRPHNAAGPNFKSFAAFLASRPKDEPFCFWFGSHHPHRPYKPGIGMEHGLDPAKVVVPSNLPDNATVRSDICDYYYETEVFDQQCAEILSELEKTGELDNTLIVMTGDNGWPFPRSKANCYDSGTHQTLAVRWGDHVKPARVVNDFISLADLAPTFIEAAGLQPPPAMTARSFLNVLFSEKSGQVDASRDHVVTCRERHTDPGRSDGDEQAVGYPIRSIITKDFHYIRNFRSNRWPAGDPARGAWPSFKALATQTYAAFSDVDAGPSKAWIITHDDEPSVKLFFDLAFDKRPARELYDLRKDPHELKNVAEDPAYAATIRQLDTQLTAEMKTAGDPRATGGGDEFDRYPRYSMSAKKTVVE